MPLKGVPSRLRLPGSADSIPPHRRTGMASRDWGPVLPQTVSPAFVETHQWGGTGDQRFLFVSDFLQFSRIFNVEGARWASSSTPVLTTMSTIVIIHLCADNRKAARSHSGAAAGLAEAGLGGWVP